MSLDIFDTSNLLLGALNLIVHVHLEAVIATWTNVVNSPVRRLVPTFSVIVLKISSSV